MKVDFDVLLRTPHEGQKQFIQANQKRVIIRAGRRGGKTTGLAILAIERFLQGKRVLYAAPTSEQTETFWQEILDSLAPALESGQLHKNETRRAIWLTHVPRNRIRCKTAWNANTLRGDYADFLILDEWQLMDEDTFDRVGAPMLADNDGDAVFLYTPPSLRSTGVSKAQDKMHAIKMWQQRENDENWACVYFSSYQNPHISSAALDRLASDMSEIAYRQEILAENLDEAPNALWQRSMFGRDKVRPAPANLRRVVVSIDPTGSASGDECGIIVAGIDFEGHGYVLADLSGSGMSPRGWASRAIEAYYTFAADRLVAETNYGGDMVQSTIETVDENVAFRSVKASRGKQVRAEPVAALYEKGRVSHCDVFTDLEDQLCLWTPDSKESPDRLDALVWAFHDLILKPRLDQQIGLPEYTTLGLPEVAR